MITKVWDRLMKSRVMEYFQANNREKLMATCTHEKKKKEKQELPKTQGKLVAVRREPCIQNLQS